ncbi:MAG: alpha/beta fold hydrolase [Pseudomonadota bacterium]
MATDAGATALYFGPDDAPVFGCWHRPAAPVRDTAVLLCPSFGREEASGHRSLHHLAQRLAASGCGVLRFDYPGTGDSAGDESLPARVAAWQRAIGDALQLLQQISGARRLVVVGLRLGTLLAAPVAAARADVAGFVAWVPVTSGRAFVREQRLLQAATVTPGPSADDGAPLEAGGYLLTAGTRESLAAIDLRKLDRPPAPRVLVIDRDDMPPSQAWLTQLGAAGSDVEHRRLPGYAAMMQDPHNTVLPEAMLQAAVDWVLDGAATLGHGPAQPRTRTEARLGPVVEQPVRLRHEGVCLAGVVSRPADGSAARQAVLLINAGAQRRVGPSRLYVTLARRWAAQGLLVLRLDLSGLGDSLPRPGTADNIVYSPTAVHEVRAALQWLQERWAVQHCTAMGLCAGAYHGFKAAVHGAPVHRVVAINPLTFFWREGTPLDAPLPAHEVAAEMARYRSNLFAAQRWRKLLRGEVNLRRLGSLLSRRLAQLVLRRARDVARWLHLPLREDLARELRQVVHAGTQLHFVFSTSDPGEELLRTEAGIAATRLLRDGALSIDRIEDADHTFSTEAARGRVVEVLSARVLGAA